MKIHSFLLLLFALGISLISSAQDYLNTSFTPEERAADLVSDMTLDEKIKQMMHFTPGISRLGLINYNYANEALHGIAAGEMEFQGTATSFPQSIAMGSTWNPELMFEVATAISDEARAYNNSGALELNFFSPNINMMRDPRWGRNEEAYSEDPYLMSRIGVEFVKGMQGDHPTYLKTNTTPKHFVANNSEYNRHDGSSNISERWLREYYFPAFKTCVTEGKAGSIMSAYNAVNGEPVSSNKWLLTTVLRDEWGFDGFVVSDCNAVDDIITRHKIITDRPHAVAAVVKAGLDLECGICCREEEWVFAKNLLKAIDQGLLQETDIDKALLHIMKARIKLGEFDPEDSIPWRDISLDTVDCGSHRDLALRSAREAMVLLKNHNNTLPLSKDLSSIAVIGHYANTPVLGEYSGSPSYKVSVLDGVVSKLPGATVSFVENDISEAASVAQSAEVAILVIGTDSDMAMEELDAESLNVPADQQTLLKAVYAANPNTVLVVVSGFPHTMTWENDNIPAIVYAWYAGQEQGNAIADVLFGDYNPGGKLPVTFYENENDLPRIGDYNITKGRTYWFFKGDVLYPFGDGLSYTNFEFSNLALSDSVLNIANGIDLNVSFDVKNTGNLRGDEVAQLYIKDLKSKEIQAFKKLRDFKRVSIDSQETSTISFHITNDDFEFWSELNNGWYIEPGEFEIQIGNSSQDIYLRDTVFIDFVTCDATSQFKLDTTINGSGTISIDPPAIEGTYKAGTRVTLTANPDSDAAFRDWTGYVSDTANSIAITMWCDRDITAHFSDGTFKQYKITTSTDGSGSGSIELDPPGGTYDERSTVKITASADEGSRFNGWFPNLNESSNPFTIYLDSDSIITAKFDSITVVGAGIINNSETDYISYYGDWKKVGAGPAVNGDAHLAEAANSTASLTFKGNNINVYVWRYPLGQKFDVFIDEAFMETITVNAGDDGKYIAYKNKSLIDTSHTIRIETVSKEFYLDAFEIETDQTGITNESAFSSDKLFLYPNPNKGNHITIKFTELRGLVEIDLVDNHGRVVINEKKHISGNTTTLAVGGLSKGIYFLAVKTNSNTANAKLVVE